MDQRYKRGWIKPSQILETAGQETLGVVKKTNTNNELCKNDTLINSLHGQRNA